jgi:methylase of polypeptide subunit release factors
MMQFPALSEYIPPDLRVGKDVQFECPDWAFRPDPWTFAFQRGLRRASAGWNGKEIWEVGVGTGINLLLLSQMVADATWYFSDFNPRCPKLAVRNIERSEGAKPKLRPLWGKWNLTSRMSGVQPAPKVDVLFGCIPQVPSTEDLTVGDRLANYYDARLVAQSRRNAVGLGLVESLLMQAHSVLLPRGTVILNLGGRPGLARLTSLFADTGYRCEVLHEEVIPQHAETSLAALAEREAAGEPDFELFLDVRARECINARFAERLRKGGKTVYHKIYVIGGTVA